MTIQHSLLRWSPRIVGVTVSLLIGALALDALDEGATAILVHLLPALFPLAVVWISWRREWIGALVFTGLGAVYAIVARWHLDWIVVVSMPLFATGLLYGWSWRARRNQSGVTHAPQAGTEASP